MEESEDLHTQVSALADGQLEGEAFAQTVLRTAGQEQLRDVWRTYHLIGDVLRCGEHAPCTAQDAFLARFQQRLAAQPGMPVLGDDAGSSAPVRAHPEAANAPVFRWRMVAGAASVAVAAVIGWNWVGSGGAPSPAGAQLAQSAPLPALLPAPVAIEKVVAEGGTPQVILRDPRLDALMEAHRQASGASQMPAGFLRSATFEAPAR